jgi:hypothetical protein
MPIVPETGQFFASRDKDYLPEVYPSIMTANLPNQRKKGERVHLSSRLNNCQTKEPTSSMFRRIQVKKSPREDSHSTDKQPDKSSPEGIPDVNDSRARHVDAMQSSWVVFSRDIYTVRPHPE